MSKVWLLNIFLSSCLVLPVINFIHLSCDEVREGALYQLKYDSDYVFIEDCRDLQLDLFKYLPRRITNLHVMNVTNLTIVTSPQSLGNIENIILFQSRISENTNFVSKAGSSIFIENCNFNKNLKIYSIGSESRDGRVYFRYSLN